MKRKIHNRKNLEPYRKKLRHHGTTAEAYLWKHLQQKKLEGRKFRRQHSILNFIVDFYCAEERLVIELDGQYHMNPTAEEKDAARTKKIEELNLKVVRFENKTVFENLDWVLEEIKNNFRSGPPRLPAGRQAGAPADPPLLKKRRGAFGSTYGGAGEKGNDSWCCTSAAKRKYNLKQTQKLLPLLREPACRQAGVDPPQADTEGANRSTIMNKRELIKLADDWFKSRSWKSFAFQKESWNAFLDGKHGLLNAPTGSGKTYALWIPIVLDYIKQNPEYKTKHKPGLKAIWITPLRALSVEIEQTANRFAEDIGSGLTVGIRTGDTSQKLRAAQKKQMPDLLITTPESLQLLLASKGYEKVFKDLNAIVIDEWHELLGTKRGVQIELALSRLKTVAPKMKIWGISATIGNLQEAREVLLGPGSDAFENSVLIRADIQKKITVKSIIPEKMETFPWRGHLGLHLIDEVVPIIRNSRTTLLFTNTRSQCEIWFQRILQKYPEFAGELAMHHGSINKETRLWVEQAIRDEQLKAVVATSSLDLGVDFAPVETIIQIGGPKGVARFLQRAGRSGHQPGKESVIYFLPTHAMELIESSALQKAVKHTVVEDRIPYLNSFDVLVQYLTTLAVSDGFFPKEIWPEVKSTFCYQAISEEQWEWLLNFITQGSQTLQAYDEYKKVEIEENGLFKVNNRAIAMRHRLQIGTIVSDAVLAVKYLGGGYIGTIEEWFISKLNPGDVFTFAGKNLELYQIKNMQVIVKKSKVKNSRFPSWAGGRMSFSAQMSELLREEMFVASEIEEASSAETSTELEAMHNIFQRQKRESIIPKKDEFLIETFKTREGYHAIFYPFEGRFVHEAMASLLAYRISLLSPITFSLAFNDYGFELLSDQQIDMQQVFDNDLFSADYLMDDLQKSLNSTEMARRKFRDIAVIAGMVFTGFPNKMIKTKHLQSNSQLLFSVFRDYEPDNLLFQQAFRETFEHQLEEGRLRLAMERISEQKLVWKQCEKPTPFAFPIITDRMREKLSSEKLEDRIKKMMAQWGDL